jgi:hypothetical protein
MPKHHKASTHNINDFIGNVKTFCWEKRVLTIKAILMPCTACTKISGIISGYAPTGISSILTSVNMDTKSGILRCEGARWKVDRGMRCR